MRTRDNILAFLRANALFESMLLGVIIGVLELDGIWTWHAPSWLLPGCIFLMLFFTFLRMDPLSLRLHRWHWVVLAFQIVVSLGLYYLLRPLDSVLAEGIFICVLMPSATAAPIIAGKLGGNVLNLTAYTLLSNGLTALLVPLLFPLVHSGAEMPFVEGFVLILRRIAPLLLGPFFLAWALRLTKRAIDRIQTLTRSADDTPRALFDQQALGCTEGSDPLKEKSARLTKELPFWLWAFTLVVLMAQMTLDLTRYEGSLLVLVAMFAGAFVACMMQFYFGKWVGGHLPVLSPAETRITAGQALGQKNTTLAVWLASTYLSPVSALAPAAYIIWQNLFNSWQLSRVSRGRRI